MKKTKYGKNRKLVKYLFLKMCFVSYFLSILFMSLNQMNLWQNDNQKILNIEKEIEEIVEVVEVQENNEKILVNEPDNKEDIYWKYKDVSLIDVNIEKLKEENNDTVGWIKVLGTNINYPIVQASDNDYYLKRDFNKKCG